MATLNGAKALNLQQSIGSIEEGKKADLVILDLNKQHTLPDKQDIYTRIVYSADKTNIDTVFVDGVEISV